VGIKRCRKRNQKVTEAKDTGRPNGKKTLEETTQGTVGHERMRKNIQKETLVGDQRGKHG
jgi:hypothetical protein